MEALIKELVGILENEHKLYETILAISRKKTDVVVEGKVTELESILKVEQQLVLQIGRVDALREQLMEKLASCLSMSKNELTVTEIMKHAKNNDYEKLYLYRESMNKIVDELKSSNELNSKLIKSSLDYIKFSLNLFTSVDVSNNYTPNGKVNESKKRNLFDIKL